MSLDLIVDKEQSKVNRLFRSREATLFAKTENPINARKSGRVWMLVVVSLFAKTESRGLVEYRTQKERRVSMTEVLCYIKGTQLTQIRVNCWCARDQSSKWVDKNPIQRKILVVMKGMLVVVSSVLR